VLLISPANPLVDSSQSVGPTHTGLNLAVCGRRRYVRRSVGVVSDERRGAPRCALLYTAAAAAATIDDVTYRSCTRPVTVAVVTVSSIPPSFPPRLASAGTSFVRDHRFLGRRRQPLGMEGEMRAGGMDREGMTSFSQSVLCGISREFDDEDGVASAGMRGVAMHSSCH